jgi:hypothetical protein
LFPLFAADVVDTGGAFATGINNTSSIGSILVAKVATGVVDTGSAHLTCEYLREFSKKFKMTLMLFSLA